MFPSRAASDRRSAQDCANQRRVDIDGSASRRSMVLLGSYWGLIGILLGSYWGLLGVGWELFDGFLMFI